jgi:hypothetical protein
MTDPLRPFVQSALTRRTLWGAFAILMVAFIIIMALSGVAGFLFGVPIMLNYLFIIIISDKLLKLARVSPTTKLNVSVVFYALVAGIFSAVFMGAWSIYSMLAFNFIFPFDAPMNMRIGGAIILGLLLYAEVLFLWRIPKYLLRRKSGLANPNPPSSPAAPLPSHL